MSCLIIACYLLSKFPNKGLLHYLLVGSCEYSDVHTYLLQVTWTLRENIFSSMKIMPPGPPLLPNILYGQPPRVLAATTITHEMDNLAISNNTNISSSPVVPSSEVKVHYIYHLFKRWQWDLSISVVYIAVFIWTHSNYVYEKPSRRCRI